MCDHDEIDSPQPTPSQLACAESPVAHARAVVDRRSFLRRSLGGLIGLTMGGPLMSMISGGRGDDTGLSAFLSPLMAADAAPAKAAAHPAVKNIIVLWMNGGPSQLDTFDPKPGATTGGPNKAIATAAKGIQISEHLPQIASVMDRMALIRCMKTGEGNHQRARTLLHTGFTPNPTVEYPGLGSIFAMERGNHESPLPQNVAIGQPGQKAGVLGMAFDPFTVNDAGKPVQNLSASKGVTNDRLDRRVEMMLASDRKFRARVGGDSYEADGHDAIMKNALRFMQSEENKVFNISDEPEAVRTAYGNTKFGRGCLLARRLVESGVKFVEVTLNGWDTHDDNFTRTAKLMDEMDPAVATLIKDLETRKLLDSTLVVWMGEFGRTPKINAREGRDHWAQAWSVALAGAGIRGGNVIGETSADGTRIVGDAVTTADLFRSIIWSTGIDPDYEYYSPKGRPMKYADGGKLIKPLFKG